MRYQSLRWEEYYTSEQIIRSLSWPGINLPRGSSTLKLGLRTKVLYSSQRRDISGEGFGIGLRLVRKDD
jgi:hypothetical protein